jgi:hypothetical protein
LRDYAVGCHPLFELFKCLGRLGEPPVLVGSAAWWIGYCCAAVQRRQRRVPPDLIEYLRGEQKRRVWRQLCPFRAPGGSQPGGVPEGKASISPQRNP